MQKTDADIVVVGGGAAGLMFAVAAKSDNPALKIIILEKNNRVGKKLLATGNGRCNLGNSHATVENYHSAEGEADSFTSHALEVFSAESNRLFFEKIGLLVTEDSEGRQYPFTNQASSVLDILRLRLFALGVETITEAEVAGIEKKENFLIKTACGSFFAKNVVLAAGGIASPQISNSNGVYKWLAKTGHESSCLYPALTQIKTAGNLPKALKGLRIPCRISLQTDGKTEQNQQGEILFTDYGVSGIPVFQLSAPVGKNQTKAKPLPQRLIIDALPQLSESEIYNLLAERRDTFAKISVGEVADNVKLEDFLTGVVNKKLGQQVMKGAGVFPLSRDCSSLSDWEVQSIAHLLKNIVLDVVGTTGWRNAQVTAGGLLLKDFNPKTMESRLVRGLYAIGEILDVYGDCGGYNLTWAWSSARMAARALTEKNNA